MSAFGIGLSIIGIILEVSAIYLTSRTIISWAKYYENVIATHGRLLKEQFKEERKEKILLILLLTTAAILQIVGLVV